MEAILQSQELRFELANSLKVSPGKIPPPLCKLPVDDQSEAASHAYSYHLTKKLKASSTALTVRKNMNVSPEQASKVQRSVDELVTKKNCTSCVWEHFGFRKTDIRQKQVLCKACRATVLTSRGNTTNLYQHLKKHHRQFYDECMSKRSKDESLPQAQLPSATARQTSVTQAFERITPYEKSSRRHREITDAIAKYLAKDMVPIYTVSKNGFQNLLLTLDKRYQLPFRTYFSQVAIPELYATCRNKVETELRNVEYYATTTDMWSSRTTEPYQSLTVHFINEHFELKSHCLQTSYFPLDHTGENIANGLKDALANWGLNEEGQVCTTTDNASNMIKAAEINDWTRLQCFGHRLHLAIGKCHIKLY